VPIIEDEETFRTLMENRHIKNIASHGDADGVSSAYICALRFRKNKPEVYFPTDFSDTKNLRGEDADLVLDKVPRRDFKGIVIDHHPDHKVDCDYALWYGREPASRLSIDLFKDDLPDRFWWKAAPGIMGDGQAEKIPVYVWESCPELLEQVSTVTKYRGNTNVYKNPVWFLLSSPLNSACRVGKKNLAFTQLAVARSPYDLIFDEKLLECKENFNSEVNRVRGDYRAIDLGALEVWIVDSNYSVNGTLAWELNNNSRKTALVINTKTRHGSIRGVLVDYLKDKMPSKWGIGGHSGFAGFSFPVIESEGGELESLQKAQVRDFIDDLREAMKI